MASNSSTVNTPSEVGLRADPRTVVGPVFVGNILNWLLLGTLAVQIYIYVNSKVRSKDAMVIQLLVYVVFVVDLFQSIVGTHEAWYYAVASWGDWTTLNGAIPWSGALVPILDGIISCQVQLFYAWRIRTLTRSMLFQVLAGVIALGALVQGAASLAATTTVLMASGSTSSLQHIQGSIDTWLAGSFANDMVIAGCMIWLLYQARSRTVWTESQSLYDRLIIQVIQTGLITAVVAGVASQSLIYFYGSSTPMISFIWGRKLYSNAFLSTLNGRVFRSNHNVSRGETSTGGDLPVSTLKVHVSQDSERRAQETVSRVSYEGNTIARADWKPTTSVDSRGDDHVYELSSFPASDNDNTNHVTDKALAV